MNNDRKKSIGGSDIGVIMGVSEYKTPYVLWQEKTGRVTPEDISMQPHVLKGTMFEDVARKEVERLLGKTFHFGFYKGKEDWMSANVDGISEDGCLLEIKTTGKAKFEDAKCGKIPLDHQYQVQWYLMITGAKEARYVNYNTATEEMAEVQVAHDLAMQSEIFNTAKDFWFNNVISDTAPDFVKGDCIEIDDPFAEEAAEKYKNLMAQIAALESEKDEMETILKTVASDYPSIKVGGVKVTKVERVGNINYKKIPVLEGLDLEQYRGETSHFYKISVSK